MTTIYETPDGTLYLDRKHAPLLVIPPSGPPQECWQLPTEAYELTTCSCEQDL